MLLLSWWISVLQEIPRQREPTAVKTTCHFLFEPIPPPAEGGGGVTLYQFSVPTRLTASCQCVQTSGSSPRRRNIRWAGQKNNHLPPLWIINYTHTSLRRLRGDTTSPFWDCLGGGGRDFLSSSLKAGTFSSAGTNTYK